MTAEMAQNLVQLSVGRYGREKIAEHLDVHPRTIKRWEAGESHIPKGNLIALEQLSLGYNPSHPISGDFSFIDLFAGIGGIRRGFDAQNGQCLLTCEWDSYSQKTYEANFPSNPNHTFICDIKAITKTDVDIKRFVPKHDVLLAGFPCQPFSIAGVSKKNSLGRVHGFACQEQGNLFFNVADILRVHRPPAFLLENVKNLKSHDKGKTFRIIMETLEEVLGYKVYYKVIDAKGFVPQHRERVFIVGFDGETDFSWDDLELPASDNKTMKDILHPGDGSEQAEGVYTLGAKAKVNDKYTLSDKLWNYLQAYARKHQEKGNGFGFGLVGPDDTSRTLSARYYKDGSEILVSRGKGKNPRRLTPRECARLMGFHDDFVIPVSDTRAYKQFGNCVVTSLVEEIARIMKPHILELTGRDQAHNIASNG
ncbi:MAG: DNA (cytosine-5-)-methyltransferase [Desulfuromonas sp.]|mgnify:CR=1 FL=1|nr:MAG: DNA (cytosine-5-)-methyltransferase [Desulfuromonas sp.]